MSEGFANQVDQLWSRFPTAADPRPIVLLESRLRLEGRFLDGESKRAWVDGAVEPSRVPADLLPYLPQLQEHAGGGLRITDVNPTVASFRCDRGPRELPAYRLELTGFDGSCTVLDPTVDVWWPHEEFDLDLRFDWNASVEPDGVTINLPAFGGVLTDFHRAEFDERDNHVIGRPITSERSVERGIGVVLIGISRPVAGQLLAPLGNRALVNAEGHPFAVIPADPRDQ